MSFQIFSKKGAALVFAAACFLAGGLEANAQTLVVDKPATMNVAERNNVYCAGYVQTSPVDTGTKIIGATEEQEQFFYVQNNDVWINSGADKGVKVGDKLSVFRPRGTVKSKWSKKGDLGFLVQEVGALEVIRVNSDHSIARVRTSCDKLLLGDLVQPLEARTSPVANPRPALDRYADPSGKATGRLIFGRDGYEMFGRDQIVYIDLGAEDNVKIGDYVTIFRPLGKGHVLKSNSSEAVEARVSDFGSGAFKGSEFSNQAPRKSGERARGSVVSEADAKEGRPDNLRKVVGEAVVLNVKERTATVVITRTAQEIVTGDWVEVQ